jgi:hypothetical protein
MHNMSVILVARKRFVPISRPAAIPTLVCARISQHAETHFNSPGVVGEAQSLPIGDYIGGKCHARGPVRARPLASLPVHPPAGLITWDRACFSRQGCCVRVIGEVLFFFIVVRPKNGIQARGDVTIIME